MRRSASRFVVVFLIGFLLPLTARAADAAAGSCTGTANAPAGHCAPYGVNAQLVDLCRCGGGSATTCGPTGSYYCQNQLGTRIKNSGGNACVGTCTWVTSPEPEELAAALDPIVVGE